MYHCAQIVPACLENQLVLPGDEGAYGFGDWEKEFFVAFTFGWIEAVQRLYPYMVSSIRMVPESSEEDDIVDRYSYKFTSIRLVDGISQNIAGKMYPPHMGRQILFPTVICSALILISRSLQVSQSNTG